MIPREMLYGCRATRNRLTFVNKCDWRRPTQLTVRHAGKLPPPMAFSPLSENPALPWLERASSLIAMLCTPSVATYQKKEAIRWSSRPRKDFRTEPDIERVNQPKLAQGEVAPLRRMCRCAMGGDQT